MHAISHPMFLTTKHGVGFCMKRSYFHCSSAPVVLEVCKSFFNDPQHDTNQTAVLDLHVISGGIQRALAAVETIPVEKYDLRYTGFPPDIINDALENGGLEQVNAFARQFAQQERVWGDAEFARCKSPWLLWDRLTCPKRPKLLEEADQYQLRPMWSRPELRGDGSMPLL